MFVSHLPEVVRQVLPAEARPLMLADQDIGTSPALIRALLRVQSTHSPQDPNRQGNIRCGGQAVRQSALVAFARLFGVRVADSVVTGACLRRAGAVSLVICSPSPTCWNYASFQTLGSLDNMSSP